MLDWKSHQLTADLRGSRIQSESAFDVSMTSSRHHRAFNVFESENSRTSEIYAAFFEIDRLHRQWTHSRLIYSNFSETECWCRWKTWKSFLSQLLLLVFDQLDQFREKGCSLFQISTTVRRYSLVTDKRSDPVAPFIDHSDQFHQRQLTCCHSHRRGSSSCRRFKLLISGDVDS